MNAEELLTLTLDIGEQMLLSGAEIYRVEDAMNRIGKAYRCRRMDVFSITSFLMATVEDENGQSFTQMRRVVKSGTDLNRLHRLNCLSRTLCASTPDLDEARREYEKVLKESRPLSRFLTFLAYFLVAGSFALLFGGSLFDAAFSAVIAVFLGFVIMGLDLVRFNPILSKIVCTFFSSVCAILCARLFPGVSEDTVIIGNIMILIPGIALTNSIRDLFSGDLMSGILRLLESILQALAIAAGYVLAAFLMGGIAG